MKMRQRRHQTKRFDNGFAHVQMMLARMQRWVGADRRKSVFLERRVELLIESRDFVKFRGVCGIRRVTARAFPLRIRHDPAHGFRLLFGAMQTGELEREFVDSLLVDVHGQPFQGEADA